MQDEARRRPGVRRRGRRSLRDLVSPRKRQLPGRKTAKVRSSAPSVHRRCRGEQIGDASVPGAIRGAGKGLEIPDRAEVEYEPLHRGISFQRFGVGKLNRGAPTDDIGRQSCSPDRPTTRVEDNAAPVLLGPVTQLAEGFSTSITGLQTRWRHDLHNALRRTLGAQIGATACLDVATMPGSPHANNLR